MVAHGPLAANPILWAKATLRRYRLPDQLRARILFGIAPGGACHAGPVASPPVGSYSTVSPLPMHGHGRFHFCGAFRRVAPPGRYPAPLLCGVRTFLGVIPAAIQPPARVLRLLGWGA